MCLSEYFEVFECIYAPVIVVLVIIELQMKLKNVPLEKSKAKTLLKKRLNEDSCRVASVELRASYGMILSHILTVQMLKEFRPNSYLV